VKATYLYKFVPFVSWPVSGSPAGPVTICVVGADPFGDVLDRAVAGQAVGGRVFQIARVNLIGPQSTCDVAYLGGSPAQSVAASLEAVKGAPILTVTEGGKSIGIIAFRNQGGRVRFEIDQDAADAAGLTISSKLLSLATTVKTSKPAAQP